MREHSSLDYSLRNELRTVWQHKFWILAISSLGAVVGFIYVLITPPEYRSVSAFIPPSLSHIKSLNFLKMKYEVFGTADDEDLERVAAALRSDTAFVYISTKFNLTRHYGIDGISDPERKSRRLKSLYDDKIAVRISSLSTIEVEVFDENPDTAAAIANEFVAYADRFVESIANRKAGIRELEKSINDFEAELRIIQDSLASLRVKFRLYHLDNMSEAISQRIAASTFNDPGFAKNYDRLVSAEQRMRFYDDILADMSNELIFRRENLNTYPTLIDIISRGVPSQIRERPKRSVVVLLCFGVTLILAVFWVAYGGPTPNPFKKKRL